MTSPLFFFHVTLCTLERLSEFVLCSTAFLFDEFTKALEIIEQRSEQVQVEDQRLNVHVRVLSRLKEKE